MDLYKKLHEFQCEVGAIAKDAKNPFFKSNYFDINSLIREIKPLLDKHRLVIQQPLTHVDGKPALKTVILDPDSESKIEEVVILPENGDPQKMGSIITYFRRYSLQSILLLQAEDDDGNRASGGFTPATAAEKSDKKFYKKNCPVCKKDYNTSYEQAKTCFPCKNGATKLKQPTQHEDGIDYDSLPF